MTNKNASDISRLKYRIDQLRSLQEEAERSISKLSGTERNRQQDKLRKLKNEIQGIKDELRHSYNIHI